MDELFESTARHDQRARPKHPTGYEPGFVLEGDGTGWLVPQPRPFTDGETVSTDREPWEAHLRKAGLDPALVEVIPPVEVRTWDAAVGGGEVRTMVYFKARIRQRSQGVFDPGLVEWVLKWKPRRTHSVRTESTVVVPWGDWQAGKGDFDGTRGTIERIYNGFDQTVDYIRTHKPTRVLVAPLGDLLENCSGHYPMQEFTTDANLREQARIVRRAITAGLKAFSDLVSEVWVLPVGGNHGENRKNGKAFSGFSDNFDISVVESVAEAFAENPSRFGHITFHVPDGELTQTVALHGHVMGLMHGHQAKGGADPVPKWWEGQMKARAPIGDADILVSGHYHRLMCRSVGPRTHIQIPAMDPGSEWFDVTKGGREPAGQVVFTVDESGWDHLRVLPAARNP